VDAGTPPTARRTPSSDPGDRQPAGVSASPTRSTSGHRPGRNDDAKRLALATGGDPNDWYRHDHQSNGGDDATTARKRLSTGKDGSSSAANGDDAPLWFASDGVWHNKTASDAETIGKPLTFSPKYVIHLFTSFARACVTRDRYH